jgi:type IV pilus biogenesis protein CpaD/CtpE
MIVRLRTLALALTVSLAACDSGPKGPGSLTARATGDSLGGVVLRVEGTGITGFTGRGTTQVYWSSVPDKVNTHRVILIDAQGEELDFDIVVEDRAMEGPVITVLQAALTDNTGASAAVATVTIER